MQANELELIYIHLQSLRNVSVMADRLSGTMSAEGQSDGAASEPTAQASSGKTDTRADKDKKKPLTALAT
jgi:hypothetical protein